MTTSVDPVYIAYGFSAFLLLGAVAMWRLSVQLVRTAERQRGWPVVPAHVTRILWRSGSERGTKDRGTYYPEYAYVVDGVEHIGEASYATGTSHYERGDELAVHVDPEDPSKSALVDDTYRSMAGGLVVGAVILALCSVGGFVVAASGAVHR